MIVTVRWEDRRGIIGKAFGPHDLLLACLADRSGRPRDELAGLVASVPKKGVGNVLKALKRDLSRLANSGPVVAVLDRDKVLDLWGAGARPPDCIAAIRDRIREDAAGGYEVVFLGDNVESLLDACCEALHEPRFGCKPTPDERDRLLGKAAWGDRAVRDVVLAACPTFARLVEKVGAVLPPRGNIA